MFGNAVHAAACLDLCMTHILQLQDAIPDRYSPDMEAQRIFDKMFDVDSKKSMYDSSRCGYDNDTSDGDDKPYPQVTVIADANPPSTSVEKPLS